jgi:hypothetical protein
LLPAKLPHKQFRKPSSPPPTFIHSLIEPSLFTQKSLGKKMLKAAPKQRRALDVRRIASLPQQPVSTKLPITCSTQPPAPQKDQIDSTKRTQRQERRKLLLREGYGFGCRGTYRRLWWWLAWSPCATSCPPGNPNGHEPQTGGWEGRDPCFTAFTHERRRRGGAEPRGNNESGGRWSRRTSPTRTQR